jgi:uncharacterized protein
MIHRIIIAIGLVVCAQAGFAQVQAGIGRQLVIHSSILKEDRTCRIVLPASYAWATDRRYPVLYLLDGESNLLHTAGSASFLSDAGEIPELIVVAITSTVRIRDFTQTDWSSHWIGGGGAGNFKSFLSKELIPDIERKYRANGFRILSGVSASGQFALYTLAEQPSMFHAYIALSPSLDWDDKLPQRQLEASFERADSLKNFLYFAWSDDYGSALDNDLRLQETLEKKSPKGFRWTARGFPLETHMSVALPAQIEALRQVFAGYRLHNDSLDLGFAYAERHFRIVSETVGYTIPVPEGIVNDFAYQELDKGNVQKALEYFRHNTDQNPHSANAFDGLADGYEKAGDRQKAIAAANTAVALAKKYRHPDLLSFIRHTAKIKARGKR